jgi:hypothetical protein
LSKISREAFQTSTYFDGLVLVEIHRVIKAQLENWEGIAAISSTFKEMGRSWSSDITNFNID